MGLSPEEKEQLGSKIADVLKDFNKILYEFWTPERYETLLKLAKTLQRVVEELSGGEKFLELRTFIVMLETMKIPLESSTKPITQTQVGTHDRAKAIVPPSF